MILELPSEQIVPVLVSVGIPRDKIRMADSVYTLLTIEDVLVRLANAITSIDKQLGLEWVEEMFDCDDWTRWTAAWASYFHFENVRTRKLQSGGSPALAEFWFASQLHAIILAVHPGMEVRVYEPQLTLGALSPNKLALRPVALARSDFESTILCRF